MKKLLIIGLPLALVIVAVLGVTGVLRIPGLTPKNAKKNAAAMYASKDDKAKNTVAAKPAKKPPAPKKPAPIVSIPAKDETKGAQALAAVWNEIPVADLQKITKTWKDQELVPVLAQMDTSLVAQLLAKFPPERASKLSKVLQEQASIVKEGA